MVYVGNIVEALHFAQENMAPLVVDQEDLGEPSEKSIQSIPTRAPDASAHRNRAVSLGASPRISSSPIDFSAIRPSSFMLPFSFPANPLSFLTSRSEARSTNESQISRENRSMTIGCASSCDHLTPSCNNKESVDSTLPLTVEDHNTYIKEAMCHLMSMLAFGTQGHNGAKGQGSFINVVPQIYLPESKELRLRLISSCLCPLAYSCRYLVDVFHLEVRRVYRFVILPSISQ